MEKLFEKLGDRLSNFFTRSVTPSSIFFILLFFNDMYFNNYVIFKYIQKLSDIIKLTDLNLLYLAIIIIFLSYGYINQLLSQLQDEFIKDNYSKDCRFTFLRDEVLKNIDENKTKLLETIGKNDYNLYQVLGKDINLGKSYVDYIKSIHSISVAISLNIIICSIFEQNYKLSLLVLLILLISHFISKNRYKVRNTRLYVNFLLKKAESKTKEKELKIKSLKVEIDE